MFGRTTSERSPEVRRPRTRTHVKSSYVGGEMKKGFSTAAAAVARVRARKKHPDDGDGK